MPELPEVETIVRELKPKVLERTFVDVWSDTNKIIKKPKDFEDFKKQIKGKKVSDIWRRAKNIVFDLSQQKSLLIHQKMTGHLLFGEWRREQGRWKALKAGPLKDDPINQFLRVIFFLDNGKMLALSDLRKFAKVELWDADELEKLLKELGPEPFAKDFTLNRFSEILKSKKGRLKQVLMDQKVIAGIGNIYSDEILWKTRLHPLKETSSLNGKEFKSIYSAMRTVLKKAIFFQGDSIQDYRLPSGEKGRYQTVQKVYRQEGKLCQRKDGGVIKKIRVGGRFGRFCPVCQKL